MDRTHPMPLSLLAACEPGVSRAHCQRRLQLPSCFRLPCRWWLRTCRAWASGTGRHTVVVLGSLDLDWVGMGVVGAAAAVAGGTEPARSAEGRRSSLHRG